MKASLQLKLSQHLALTPQLQQSIKLLQLSTVEMEQEIERYLQENPLLERDESHDLGHSPTHVESNNPPSSPGEHEQPAPDSAYEAAQDTPAEVDDDRWGQEAGSYSASARDEDDDGDPQEHQGAQLSLRAHLGWQVGMIPLEDRDRTLVHFLIEALDEDGYLSSPLTELWETMPAELEIELQELEIALKHIQHLDPVGVGARNPGECLLLQLQQLPISPARTLAIEIIQHGLDLLASRDFNRLKKMLGCSDEALKEAHQMIIALNPRPGARFSTLETRYIIPDVIVRKIKGIWTAYINPDAYPRLRINRLYADILSRQKRASSNLSGQLQEARWLIKNVQQRFETILRVSQTIVARQRGFFEHGEVAMRPLVLREIAEILELHESTISRVTSQKYMSTPRGLFELKYFFGSHVSTDTGGACSATAIRALIKQLIAGEDGKKPLSDSQISEILGQQGIVVARRTVAKYRESLNIPPVNLRKTL